MRFILLASTVLAVTAGPARAQFASSAARCSTTPTFPGCYQLSTDFDATAALPLIQGDRQRTVTLNTLFGRMLLGSVIASNPTNAPILLPSGDASGMSVRTGGLTASTVVQSVFGADISMQDGLQSVLVLPAGSTVKQANGFGTYVRVATPYAPGGAVQVGVGYSGSVETTVDQSAAWGSALALKDSGPGTGAGRRLVGAEYDFNITKTGTLAEGVVVTGASTVAPSDDSAAFIADRLNGTITGLRWPTGFLARDNASIRAFTAGTSQPLGAASVNSQLISFRATNGAGSPVETWAYSTSDALHVTGPSATRDFVVDNGRLIGTNGLLLGASTAKASLTADGGGSLTITAPNLTVPNVLVGSGAPIQASVSADASGNLILTGNAVVTSGGYTVWDGRNLVIGTGITATRNPTTGVTVLTTTSVANFSKAGEATTSDVPVGQCIDWANTTAGTFKHVCNFSGTLRSMSLN